MVNHLLRGTAGGEGGVGAGLWKSENLFGRGV